MFRHILISFKPARRIAATFTFGKPSEPAKGKFPMSHVTYKIVEHDGGWAYTVNGVFSESFATHAKALTAARRAAAEQRVPGRTEEIQYETADGKWHTETAAGNDRPDTDVEG
jgi:Uncharacterized protein conserved in bacteria (DUF2188)